MHESGARSEVQQLKDKLARAECQRDRNAAKLHALMNAAEAILGNNNFTESARAIFDYCRQVTGATSGYVALLNADGSENELLFLESGGLPCSVDPNLPMPIRGLRAEAYRTAKPVRENDFMNSKWAELMPSGHVNLRNVLFAPLVVDGKTCGLIGLANKPEPFDKEDAAIAGGFGHLAAIALRNSRDIEARNRAEAELERQASTDALTGLPNRRAFMDTAQQEFERSKRYSRSLSCMMVDLDHFKRVNDKYGHSVGDLVLKAFAEHARQSLRKHDAVGRIGGEEFAVLLPETGCREAVTLAERLGSEVRNLNLRLDGQTIRFTVSIGVAQSNAKEHTFEQTLKRADAALYEAKEAGRNRVHANSPS